MAEHPSAQWPVLILELGVLRVLRWTWVAVLPFWITAALLLGEHPAGALVVALAAGPVLAGLAWHRLGPWRRAMPAGLRRFLSQMWRTLPIMPGLVVSTVVCWSSTVAMAVVNLVGSPRAVHSAVVTSIVAGVASFVILHVLQRATLPTLVARSKAPL